MLDSRSGLTWLIPPGIAALALSLSMLSPAAAEPGAQSDPGVARLSDLAGGVDMRRSDTNDAFAGALNAPVTVGDYLTTRHDAHAEVEFNNAALVRIAPDSQVRFVKLDPGAHELQLAEGTVEMRVIKGLDAHPVIDTPEVTIRPLAAGRYRIDVDHDGNTEVTVRSGKAEAVVGDNFAKRIVTPGNSLLVEGDGPQAQIRNVQDVAFDDFDRYGADRDQRWNDPNPTAYEDRGIVGANDLDGNGHWTDAADYGPGWQPNEPAGWSPYSDGRWVWQPYYGWTWVGNEPWGYAPYHYGRWLYTAAGWVWYPGAGDQPYEYAPAEVGFFGDGVGGGGGINIELNFGGGSIGWSPLAPFEALSKWWGGGSNGLAGLASLGSFGGNSYGGSSYGSGYGGYRHNGSGGYGNNGYSGSGYNGNGTGLGYPHNAKRRGGAGENGLPYANSGAPGGAIGTTAANFAAGRFGDVHPIERGALTALSPLKGLLPIVPTVANLAYNGRGSNTNDTASPISSRFRSLQPVERQVVSFEQQRAAVASAVSERPGAGGDRERPAYSEPQQRSEASRPSYAAPVGNEARSGASGGTAWERFGRNPGPQNESAGGAAGNEAARTDRADAGDGWSRFNRSDAPQNDLRPARDTTQPYAARSDDGNEAFRRFDNGARSNAEQSRPYSGAPSYSQPRSYAEPSRSYAEPSRSYAEPSRSYSQPRSYAQPSRSYAQPRYSEPRSSARSQPSHAESRGSDHSSHKDNSKHR